MISKRTNTLRVDDMIRKDIRTVAENTAETCREQWNQRKNFKAISVFYPSLKRKNGLHGVPNGWVHFNKYSSQALSQMQGTWNNH